MLYFRENPTTDEAYVLKILETRLVILVPRFGIEVCTCACAVCMCVSVSRLDRQISSRTMYVQTRRFVHAIPRTCTHRAPSTCGGWRTRGSSSGTRTATACMPPVSEYACGNRHMPQFKRILPSRQRLMFQGPDFKYNDSY